MSEQLNRSNSTNAIMSASAGMIKQPTVQTRGTSALSRQADCPSHGGCPHHPSQGSRGDARVSRIVQIYGLPQSRRMVASPESGEPGGCASQPHIPDVELTDAEIPTSPESGEPGGCPSQPQRPDIGLAQTRRMPTSPEILDWTRRGGCPHHQRYWTGPDAEDAHITRDTGLDQTRRMSESREWKSCPQRIGCCIARTHD